MAHDHNHVPATSAGARYLPRLVAALVLGLIVLGVELAAAIHTGSLALASDAAHLVTDVVGLLMALTAVLLAKRGKPNQSKSFGYYRAEVLAALANAVLLFAAATYVLVSAIIRLSGPPEVPGAPVLVVGIIAICANLIAFMILRSGASESINVRGAYLEVLADLVGSVAVVISAAVTLLTGWLYADMVFGILIGLWVLPRAVTLGRRALRILFQHSPDRLDIAEVDAELTALDGVENVHDLHIWTLTSGMEVASAHIAITGTATAADVLAAAQHLLEHKFGIEHATLQVEEPSSAANCHELSW